MDKKELSLIHEVLAPKSKNEKAPLLIMLHGYGSHEKDLFSFAPELNNEFFIVSVRAPITLGYGSFAWYQINFDRTGAKMNDIDQAKESLNKIDQFVDEVIEAYPVDGDDVSLLGFSQGCILSYASALNNPLKYKHIIALSGYVLEDIVPTSYKKEELKHLDLFISHGNQDPVLPVEWARQSLKVLEQLKISHQYREYPIGHGINEENFHDLKKWLVDRDLA